MLRRISRLLRAVLLVVGCAAIIWLPVSFYWSLMVPMAAGAYAGFTWLGVGVVAVVYAGTGEFVSVTTLRRREIRPQILPTPPAGEGRLAGGRRTSPLPEGPASFSSLRHFTPRPPPRC